MCRLIGPHWACTHPCPTTHSRVLSHRRQRASTAKQSSRWCWAVGACSPLLLTLDNLHFGRARLTGCRVYLCGRGRCVHCSGSSPRTSGMPVWWVPWHGSVARSRQVGRCTMDIGVVGSASASLSRMCRRREDFPGGLRAHVLVCVPRAEVAKVGGVVQSVVRARGYLRRVRLRRDVVDKDKSL